MNSDWQRATVLKITPHSPRYTLGVSPAGMGSMGDEIGGLGKEDNKKGQVFEMPKAMA